MNARAFSAFLIEFMNTLAALHEEWIGRGDPVSYARSDSTSFLLRSHEKSPVYTTPVDSAEDLLRQR